MTHVCLASLPSCCSVTSTSPSQRVVRVSVLVASLGMGKLTARPLKSSLITATPPVVDTEPPPAPPPLPAPAPLLPLPLPPTLPFLPTTPEPTIAAPFTRCNSMPLASCRTLIRAALLLAAKAAIALRVTHGTPSTIRYSSIPVADSSTHSPLKSGLPPAPPEVDASKLLLLRAMPRAAAAPSEAAVSARLAAGVACGPA
mmetsp:Transcript_1291/g.4784  ORF Transcript_1291/g.4784 Transcript_1291/m.4784 type:complete len:200 (+) Transcript_1291:1067-1666(+)